MEFKLNRNNKILEAVLKNGAAENEQEIKLGTVELNQTYIPDMEQILNGQKTPDENTYLMVEKMQVLENDYKVLELGGTYALKASALSLSGQNIYCFDLNFNPFVLEKIGSKKREGEYMVLKNIRFKYLTDGEYTAREVSGITSQETNNMKVSVVTGDKVAAVKL